MDIKPCPKCGSTRFVLCHDDRFWHHINCVKCGFGVFADWRTDAINLWNEQSELSASQGTELFFRSRLRVFKVRRRINTRARQFARLKTKYRSAFKRSKREKRINTREKEGNWLERSGHKLTHKPLPKGNKPLPSVDELAGYILSRRCPHCGSYSCEQEYCAGDSTLFYCNSCHKTFVVWDKD